jgi:hypothetical protein
MHPPVAAGAERAEKLYVEEPFSLPSASMVDFHCLPFADEASRMRCQELAP